MAAELKRDLNEDTELEVGNTGEFTVWYNGTKVAEKQRSSGFPEPAAVVAAVRALLEA